MAVDKLVDSTQLDADLTSVANAIRTKGGTSASLAFPAGFVQAIGDIPSGGGGYTLKDVLEVGAAGVTGDISYSGNSLPPFAFVNNIGLTGFSSNTLNYLVGTNSSGAPYRSFVNNLNASNTFRGCQNLERIDIPNLTTLAYCDNAFRDYSSLRYWQIPFKNFPSIGSGTFYNCTYLPSLVLKSLNDPFYADTFYECTNLLYIDTGEALTANRAINANSFRRARNMSMLVFRSSNYMFTLSNVSAFADSPFASNGSGGTLYVPASLLSSYQSATNWSTILGYANNQIKSIESTHTDPTAPIDLTLYYADGTPISA